MAIEPQSVVALPKAPAEFARNYRLQGADHRRISLRREDRDSIERVVLIHEQHGDLTLCGRRFSCF
jgi:hypothetical protein